MDRVTLELRPDPGPLHQLGGDKNASSLVIEAWSLKKEDWAALIDEMADTGGKLVDIVSQRDVLASQSTYFRALFGNFREAGLDRINVNWDATSFMYLLQFIFYTQSSVSSARVANLLEAATFFGVDAAIMAVEKWTSSASLSRDPGVINDVVQNLPHIWSTSCTLGHQSVAHFCPQFLAVNFVFAIALSSFLDLPLSLLSASIAHPLLTVHSEKQLCNALVRWYKNQSQDPQFGDLTRGEHSSLLSQVQKTLIPKSFFHRHLLKNNHLDPSKSMIRITNYSECLDLSGCFEVTDMTLFTSAARTSLDYSENLEGDAQAPTSHPSCCMSRAQYPPLFSFAPEPSRKSFWPKIPSFGNLKQVNLSQCWKIPQDSLVIWLGEACPNLLELKLMNCPQITISILQALAAVCPLLEVADFSLETTYVNSQEAKFHSTEENSSWVRTDATGLWRCSFSELAKLSLQGHSEISDLELLALAVCSRGLIEIDLSMCTALSDGGIARFLKAYPRGLKSLKARRTAFGSLSCAALPSTLFSQRSEMKEPNDVLFPSLLPSISPGLLPGFAKEIHCLPLITLDLEGCRGSSEEDLFSILSTHSSLIHLGLGETNLTDLALSSFTGTSLQQLDLRETKVSGVVLASIIQSNPELRSLDIRGCKRACIDEYDLLMADTKSCTSRDCGTHSVPFIFRELGRCHKLEDLKVGWRFSYYAQLTLQPASLSLKSLIVSVGGTISDLSLQELSEHCKTLTQFTLLFQVFTENALVTFLDKVTSLRRLELQYCPVHLSTLSINAISTRCGPTLSVLKLERVAPWILDSDILVLSEKCTQLTHLSLVGCKALSADSLRIIAKNWCTLTQLKLEDCKTLTSEGAHCLLHSCGVLEMLTLRHNGQGLPTPFVRDAIIHFPLLRYLSLDVCDSVGKGFETPNQVRGVLNTLLIARCKIPHHAFQHGSASNISTQGIEKCHRETIVTQWNINEAKVHRVKDRL